MWTSTAALVAALAITSIGFVSESLLWLAVTGAVVFVGTFILGIVRQYARGSSA
jgi:hypothetical protein